MSNSNPLTSPTIEQQDINLLVRAAKEAVNGAEKERDEIQELMHQVKLLQAEQLHFEEQIDHARNWIFMLLLGQMREQESLHTDEYVIFIDEAIRSFLDKDKKPKT